MRATLAATGKFHFFDLGRQLAKHGALDLFFTAYPKWKLNRSTLEFSVASFPWVHTPYMALQRTGFLSASAAETIDLLNRTTFDNYVADKITPCDVFTAISGCGLRSGAKAKSIGAKYVCDRGSTHILYQRKILEEEYKYWNITYTPTHPGIVEREIAEYEQADLITVPSQYARHTFLAAGIDSGKLRVIPYGVDLSLFYPVQSPPNEGFTVLFVGMISLRKGVQYLVQAFAKLRIPGKRLWLVGQADPNVVTRLKKLRLWPNEASIIGHVDQRQLARYMSSANVLVLPSIEDGFGLVLAQALACGCPVVASDHTGARELVQHSINGYIVPPRDVDALSKAIDNIARNPSMRESAINSVEAIDGWKTYGENVLATYNTLCSGV